jgi:class 3 adenylate cyclase/tetratricopeptide (TPR) repeat protein
LNCQACGTLNPTGHKFCGACGAALVSGCPACGFVNPPGHRFCGACGAPQDAARAEVPTPAATLTGSAPVAERRLVTVLFADIVGFTPFAEERDAEDVRETLSAYFDLATDIVGRYGGTIEKFIGDAVMAVWGAPIAREEDVESAVRAALELVDAVRALGPAISARAGVLTGEAAVTLGAVNQGMVAGDLVNTASRLQAVAEPGTVIVGEATYRAAIGAISFEPLGERALKGKAEPVAVWRAVRVVAERGGRGRSTTLEAPFVGRDEELRLLKDQFHATTREGRPRLVSLTGIAGIGKSRLVWEFLKYIDGIAEVVQWNQGRSPSYGEGVTFWPLAEMVRQRAGVTEADDEQATRAGVAGALDKLDLLAAERALVEPALLQLLGIGSGVASEQLFGAWRTFFERVATIGTAILVFEDLHWADQGTLDFIDHLLEWSRSAPICIVTLARPELHDRRAHWGNGHRAFTSVFLEPLPASVMRELLAGLVPGLDERAAEAIVTRAEGVPLYAVETVRTLVADGRLRATDEGLYEPVGSLAELAVPDTLTALIAARLDALAPRERALVLDAAVLGQSFASEGLAAVAGIPAADVDAQMPALMRGEVFTRVVDPMSPERGQYQFVQALIREVAYNTLAKKDRKSRHLAAARYFERLGSDEMAGALAGHYLAAHDLATEPREAETLAIQACIALVAAGDRARSLAGNLQASRLYEQACAVTTEPAQRAELQLSAGVCASLAGDLDRAEDLLVAAVMVFRTIGDLPGVARAAAALGRRYLIDYRFEDARRIVQEAAAETDGLAGDPSLIELDLVLGTTHYYADEASDAVIVLDRVLAMSEAADLAPIVAEALAIRGAALCDQGRSYEGLADIDGAIALATDLQLPMLVLRGTRSKATAVWAQDPRASWAVTLEVVEMARRLGSAVDRHRALGNAIDFAMECGEWETAERGIADLETETLSSLDRLFMSLERISLDARRGRPVREQLDRVEKTQGAMAAGGGAQEFVIMAFAEEAMARGDTATAAARQREAAALSMVNAPNLLIGAAQAALIGRDAAGARGDLEALAATGSHGRMISVHRMAITAGIDALEGRRDAARSGFRAALDSLGSMRLTYQEALTGIVAAATLGADDDVAVAAAVRSREILEGLDARAMLALLAGALEAAAVAAIPE